MKGSARIEWARLLWHVWGVDALECPGCGGRMRMIAAITERVGIVRILDHLDVSTGGAADQALARQAVAGSSWSRREALTVSSGTMKAAVRASGTARSSVGHWIGSASSPAGVGRAPQRTSPARELRSLGVVVTGGDPCQRRCRVAFPIGSAQRGCRVGRLIPEAARTMVTPAGAGHPTPFTNSDPYLQGLQTSLDIRAVLRYESGRVPAVPDRERQPTRLGLSRKTPANFRQSMI